MEKEQLGTRLGDIQYNDTTVWSKVALHLLRWLHLPFWKQRQSRWALCGFDVYEQGIVVRSQGRKDIEEQIVSYQQIRKVWIETFRVGDEQEGHESVRLDVIAQNLDVILSLTLHDRTKDDAEAALLNELHQRWKKATWKHYHVVAAVIEHEGRYLCMQKPQTRYAYTSYHWEFPGGKVEQGESEPEALRRELQEEMDYDIEPQRHLITVEHSYPDFSLSLSCWLCTAQTTDFVRKEHADHRWLTPAEMQSLDWCEADAPVIELLYKSADHCPDQ